VIIITTAFSPKTCWVISVTFRPNLDDDDDDDEQTRASTPFTLHTYEYKLPVVTFNPL
jgi:hypothetical protein